MKESGKDLAKLEKILGVTFQDKTLLEQALVHRSYRNEHPSLSLESNERLEFLGDAFLDLVVAEELYQRYPQLSEGELTSFRGALVQGKTLARIASRLSLGEFLYLGAGEENSGGRTRPSNLADLLEALVGAAFLDQGYLKARQLALRLLEPEMKALSKKGIPKDPKSKLQEWVQARGKAAPLYRVVATKGPDHDKRFLVEALVENQVLGKGWGKKKSQAEQQAARQALRKLQQGTSSGRDGHATMANPT